MSETDPSVAELLEQSRAAHDEYRANVPRMASAGGGSVVAIAGDVVKAAAALERAARLRKQAHDTDPDLQDDAWTVDHVQTGGPHVLLTWYAEHLGREDDPVAVAARRIADRDDNPIDVVQDPGPVKVPPISPMGFPAKGGG